MWSAVEPALWNEGPDKAGFREKEAGGNGQRRSRYRPGALPGFCQLSVAGFTSFQKASCIPAFGFCETPHHRNTQVPTSLFFGQTEFLLNRSQ